MTAERTGMRLILAAAVLVLGCGSVQPYFATESAGDRWVDPQSQWVVHRKDLELAFKLKPDVPDEAQQAELEISIVDLSSAPPKGVADARVRGTALMPRKPGHIHVLDLVTLHKEVVPGTYGMHVTFGMGGEWLAQFRVSLPDGRTFNEEFPFVVSGSDQPPWERRVRR